MFSSELQKFTREQQLEVQVTNYRELIACLLNQYAELSEESLRAMAVAIDGVIIHDPLLEPIEKDSEVHFLYRISGG